MKPQIQKALEEVQHHFRESLYPTSKQSDLRDRNLKLLNETPDDWESLSTSATYRHKAVQNIFTSIAERFGYTKFFLAIHALSLSALQSVDNFVSDYGKWLDDAEIPAKFVAYAAKSKTAKRCTDGEGSPQNPSKRRRRTSASEISGEAVTSDNHSEDLEETESEPPPADAPMGGSVYVLKRLDAIGALVNEPYPHVKLTMPHHDLRPFITFQCSEELAKEILKKRKRIM
ncbi:hypothetical protein FOXYS1_14427 [Fusarium oxysporum]|uniref:Uncharacterized protein n=1 Tax=Fusarium oxysporum TaxID=5507 RepID=A0A8H4ZWQ7_FUSOX|nr:hypothetical protein FOXYS1_14427 [Fusarium oxysporum]